MNYSAIVASTLLAACTLTSARAQDIAPEMQAAARQVAVTSCATCHGTQGRSVSPKFPRLAGQHATYLVAQMSAFKSHARGDADALGYMWGMASPLEDELVAAVAAYYSAQQPARGIAGDPAAMARGKDIFLNGVPTEGIPACAACHGADAKGTDDFPRLAGQSAQYMLKQLGAFQTNMRNVATMHGIASGLHDKQMADLVTYLQSL